MVDWLKVANTFVFDGQHFFIKQFLDFPPELINFGILPYAPNWNFSQYLMFWEQQQFSCKLNNQFVKIVSEKVLSVPYRVECTVWHSTFLELWWAIFKQIKFWFIFLQKAFLKLILVFAQLDDLERAVNIAYGNIENGNIKFILTSKQEHQI